MQSNEPDELEGEVGINLELLPPEGRVMLHGGSIKHVIRPGTVFMFDPKLGPLRDDLKGNMLDDDGVVVGQVNYETGAIFSS